MRKSDAHKAILRKYRPYRLVANAGMWLPILISPFGQVANIISSAFFVGWGLLKYMVWRERRALHENSKKKRWRPLPTPPIVTMPPGWTPLDRDRCSFPSVPHGLGHEQP